MTEQVKALFMEDSRTKHRALVTKTGEGEINKRPYRWIQLNETIFHPKGGGQPSDEGLINGSKVACVHKDFPDKNRKDQFEIYHCFEPNVPFLFTPGDEVELEIDGTVRLLHSQLHTAGHVLADAVNQCFPELLAYQGNHYHDNSYVKFKMNGQLATENKEEIKQKAEAVMSSWIKQNIKVDSVLEPSGLRLVKVYNEWSPCGGTHVKELKEIGHLEISDISINKKESTVTIKYQISG